MARRYVRHSLEFKRKAVERMRSCDSVKTLAKELDVQRRLLYRWAEEFGGKRKRSKEQLSDSAIAGQLRQQLARVKTALPEEMMKTRFFRDALQRVEDRRRSSSGSGGKGSTTKSER